MMGPFDHLTDADLLVLNALEDAAIFAVGDQAEAVRNALPTRDWYFDDSVLDRAVRKGDADLLYEAMLDTKERRNVRGTQRGRA